MRQNRHQDIIDACRADAIPVGESGLWYVKKWELEFDLPVIKHGREIVVPAGYYTNLHRWTDATIHLTDGELVMTDMEDELVTHLEFILRAKGRILVTGLGLGCCVRGMLAKPEVTSVTVLENSPDVMKLVLPHMPKDPRLTIIEAEASEWCAKSKERFDCVWHDVWTDTSAGECVLAVKHSSLFIGTIRNCDLVGAWAFPRHIRRAWRELRSKAPKKLAKVI